MSDEAERLLDELIEAAANAAVTKRWRNDPESIIANAELLAEQNDLKYQLLPLIRAGLAVQRLEKCFFGEKEGHWKITSDDDGVLRVAIYAMDAPGCYKIYRSKFEPTIPAAINAALDAAGVE